MPDRFSAKAVVTFDGPGGMTWKNRESIHVRALVLLAV